MAIDKDEGDVRPQQRSERVDATFRLPFAAGFLHEPLARVVVPDEPQRVEWIPFGDLGVALVLHLDHEGIGRRLKTGGIGHPRVVLHAQVVLAQEGTLAGVVGDDVKQALLEERMLLRRAVEGRDQDGLAAATFAEHGDVLFPHPQFRCHAVTLASAVRPRFSMRMNGDVIGTGAASTCAGWLGGGASHRPRMGRCRPCAPVRESLG